MPSRPAIAIVGDRRPGNETHLATDGALAHSAGGMGIDVEVTWVPSIALPGAAAAVLAPYDAVLVAPGSPYESMTGVLDAITYARTNDVPLLGTCGGFQHVVIEFARQVAGIPDAAHAESDPHASVLLINALTRSLAGRTMKVAITEGSQAQEAYGGSGARERYYCNFGLDPQYLPTLVAAGLVISGEDQDGEPRIVELPGHPFFVATLFVPQTSSTPDRPHPLVTAFVDAAVDHARRADAA